MKLHEETIERQDIFDGKILKVHRDKIMLENGRESYREVVDHPGGVCIAALTKKDEILFVRQYRYPYHEIVLELPAGKLEPGEDAFEAMKREQLEETGTKGKNYIFIGDMYPSPGYTNEIIKLWACRITEEGGLNLDEDEFLEVERIPYKEAVKMIMANEIPDAKTQVAVLKTAELIDSGAI